MAVYDLEEQDKIDDLKAFWRRWGNAFSTVVIAICLAFIGVQGWRWYQNKQADEAAVLYGAVASAVRANDVPKARDAMSQLAGRFGSTGYAPRAALLYAKLAWDQRDKAGAKAQLTWVVDYASDDDLKQIARYRLAEALLDEKNYDEALKVLDAKHSDAYAGLYADLRGDALAAAGRREDARAAYQVALAKIDAKTAYRQFVQVKLDSMGGTTVVPAKGADAFGKALSAPPGATQQPAPKP